MIEAEVKFDAPVRWMKLLVESYSARIKIRDIRKSEGQVKDLIDLFIPGDRALNDKALGLIGDRSGHYTVIDDHHGLAIVSAGDCPICNNLPVWDIFLIDAHTTENGDIMMKALFPNEKTISGFLERLEKDGVKFELRKKQNLNKKNEITARQEFVVRTALELGYFDYPKKINLEGLSSRLNVSYVTLAEILRRAEKKIISAYFQHEN
jgi:hypothetical protein